MNAASSLNDVLQSLGLRTEKAGDHGAKHIFRGYELQFTGRAWEVWEWLKESGQWTQPNAYEAKKAARVERYRERADKARQEANDRANSANIRALRDTMGQPILVGHHSERGHRALIARADNDMRKSCEASAKAKHYDRKAKAAKSNRAISSDDPDALEKLQDKLEHLQKFQSDMKAANKIIRGKLSEDQKRIKLTAIGFSDQRITEILHPKFERRPGYPAYALQNNNANIKRVEKRIAQLSKQETKQDEQLAQGDGWRLEGCPEDNRVRFYFDSKPDEETRSTLKRFGFRWARSIGAWQRFYSGKDSALIVAELLHKMAAA